MSNPKVARTLAFVFAVLVCFVVAGSWIAGTQLVRPAPTIVSDQALDVPHEIVTFLSSSGSEIHGWFLPGFKGRAGVILMHGVRANRLSMISRARFLNHTGLSVLLFDFQAHGESPGQAITFGHREAQDAQAAVRFMRTRLPNEPLGVFGISLGGAATLLGKESLPVQAAILEAVYPTIEAAISNRLAIRFGPLGRLMTPLLLSQLPLRLHIAVDEMSPVRAIVNVEFPAVVSG